MTFRSGDLNPRFSVIFPPMIWILMDGEDYKIKSKQASKRGRTLPFTLKWLWLDGRTSLIVSYHYLLLHLVFQQPTVCNENTLWYILWLFFCFYSSYDINSLFFTLLAEQIEQKLLCLIKRPGQIMLFLCANLADKK